MKYINKVIKTNADGEQYHQGYKVEITKLELAYLSEALSIAWTETTNQEMFDNINILKDQFRRMKIHAEKGNVNMELDPHENGIEAGYMVIDEMKDTKNNLTDLIVEWCNKGKPLGASYIREILNNLKQQTPNKQTPFSQPRENG